MRFVYSSHWLNERRSIRKEITDDLFEYAIIHSKVIKDKYHNNAFNAICRIPPMGRMLKVVYRSAGKDRFKIITAYWID